MKCSLRLALVFGIFASASAFIPCGPRSLLGRHYHATPLSLSNKLGVNLKSGRLLVSSVRNVAFDNNKWQMSAGKKKILVLGGDGFCGWPTSLHLSDSGHDVVIVDNLSRRNIDIELGCDSLTPIAHPEVRVKAWQEVSGKTMKFINLDVAKEYDLLVELIRQERPDAIVHFAEQRAAPYSMKTSKHKRYTVDNNVGGTNNLLAAVLVRYCSTVHNS
jgi:hypothetical protein